MSVRGSHDRLVSKLEEAFGPELCAALDDPEVTEVMLNPDGRLYVEVAGRGMSALGLFDVSRAETLIGIVAHALGQEIHARRPIVSGEIPRGRHRFEGLLPPVVSAPTFSIRRRMTISIPLEHYLETAVMTELQLARISHAIGLRKNILICGGTGSGKTTLANAMMLEIHRLFPRDRTIIIEDTAEIDCTGDNVVALRTSDDVAIDKLLKSSLRLRPDRIIVGEVRDGAALTLLKAWNTGHPGGLTTLHANDAASALVRLEQLIAEASEQPMPAVIADAVDMIVSIRRSEAGRRVEEVVAIDGFEAGHYKIT